MLQILYLCLDDYHAVELGLSFVHPANDKGPVFQCMLRTATANE